MTGNRLSARPRLGAALARSKTRQASPPRGDRGRVCGLGSARDTHGHVRQLHWTDAERAGQMSGRARFGTFGLRWQGRDAVAAFMSMR